MSFNMNSCKPGDKLISRHGMIFEYVSRSNKDPYPHVVRYPDGSMGTRCDDGKVAEWRPLPTDHDIVGFAN